MFLELLRFANLWFGSCGHGGLQRLCPQHYVESPITEPERFHRVMVPSLPVKPVSSWPAVQTQHRLRRNDLLTRTLLCGGTHDKTLAPRAGWRQAPTRRSRGARRAFRRGLVGGLDASPGFTRVLGCPGRAPPRLQPLPQHFLYFLPLPHGHGSLRPILGSRTKGSGAT